jgi:hypothetical protein
MTGRRGTFRHAGHPATARAAEHIADFMLGGDDGLRAQRAGEFQRWGGHWEILYFQSAMKAVIQLAAIAAKL